MSSQEIAEACHPGVAVGRLVDDQGRVLSDARRSRRDTERMYLESRHVATSIDRSAADVYAYAADPANLRAWAKGLADAELERIGDRWVVDSPLGRVTIEFTPANAFGILDHDVTLPDGETVNNPMRVVANADGCDVVFTVRRRSSMSAADLDADCAAVAADLTTLKRLMEAQ